ncbi:MAG: sulfatase [Kiritimatiellaeota bacterium]|nr:sulfatase [Kiritimatiellota bacterium]
MKTRPNIILILMDDMGWRDIGCAGSTFYETPNLDRLASQGMMFTQACAACPVCSPTRASLLTGKYPARLGVTDWIDHGNFHPCRGAVIDAPYVKQLSLSERSLARSLKEDGGYATWHVGKWHLGQEPHWPEHHGFDVNIGGCEMGSPWRHGYFSPWKIPTLSDDTPGEYLPDRLTDEALRLIDNRDPSKPFFLNFWDYCVHTPIQAKPEKIEKYRRKAAALGLDPEAALVEGELFQCEHKRNQRVRRRVVQSDPAYAAMIESVDENIGRLLAKLDEHGIADNTLVIFTSDNGGLSTSESSPTCNLPLSEGKGWMYEGGTREPLLVRLPGVIAPGSTCGTPVTSPDFYPTLLEIAGLALRPEQHMDGVSFLPLLKGETAFQRGAMFWHYPHYGNQGGTPGSSVRDGDWKLIEFFVDNRLELYNLRDDPGETRNLAAVHPETAARLHALLKNWRVEVCAKIPEQNPAWKQERGL